MKLFYTLVALWFLTPSNSLFAQLFESEPNNEMAAANELPLSTALSGEICIWDNHDWYEIVLPEDGLLQISLSSAGEGDNPASPFYFQLHSATGNPFGEFSPTAGEFGVMQDDSGNWCCLKAGTFYLYAYSGYVFDYCYDYTITLDLIPASFENDSEPNSNLTDNLAVVAYNTPTEGHLSFVTEPGSSGTDGYDNYKIIPPMNGVMRLIIETEAQSTGSNNLNVMLHNGAGVAWYQQTTPTGAFLAPTIDTLFWDCTPNDTMIVQLFSTNFNDRGYAYRLRYDIVAPQYPDDHEPNNTASNAEWVEISAPVTGNQYYYGDSSDDIFKFFKPDTGFFKVRVTSTTGSSDGNLGTKVQLFDHNFSLLYQLNAPLGVNGALALDSMYFAYLPSDTFYVKVYSDYAYAACRSYLLEFDYVDIEDGIPENAMDNLLLFPNPAKEYFILDTRHLNGVSVIEITNAMGAVILKENTNSKGLHHFDSSGIAPGVYFVSVYYGSQKHIQRLIICD